MADLSAIGERIRARRKDRQLTTTGLAELVGVGQSTIVRWERGEAKTIDGDKLELVAEALGMSFGYLLYGDDTHVLTSAEEDELRNKGFATAEARAKARLTQAELAAKMGVDQSLISRIENGDRAPTPWQRAQLEELIGLPTRIVAPETESYWLLRRVPARWPKGLVEFVNSSACAELKLRPVMVPVLAAAAVHPEYWKPADEAEWVALAKALLRDFATVDFAVIPEVTAEKYKDLKETGGKRR